MDILWKKEHKNAGAFYVDIFKDIQNQFPNECKNIEASTNALYYQLYLAKEKKNNQIAMDYRKKGNKEFADCDWLEAMHSYNESICFSENGSENLSIAFANRSACFMKLKLYKKCIIDIELAIGAKYPKELMSKILKRKELCMNLAEGNQPEDVSPTLSFDVDHNFPDMANMLELKYNKEFGRHITAKCDIDVGKIVLIEEAFVTTFYAKNWKKCSNCSKSATNLIPCNGCTYAMYCSGVCIESDIFHKTECQLYNIGLTPEKTDQMTILRSIFAAVNIFPCVDELMTFVEETVKQKRNEAPTSTSDPKSKYFSFLQLNVHWTLSRDIQFPILIYEVFEYISMLASLREIFDTPKKIRFLMHLIGQHICIISNNAFKSTTQRSVYLTQSYFNHSCSPNLIHYRYQNKSICITSRPIEKGEQLFISYLALDHVTEFRQNHLYENYGFRCKCERCEPCFRSIASDKRKFPNIMKEILDLAVSMKNLTGTSKCFDKKIVLQRKEMCIEFLSKYGRLHWNDQIQVVTQDLMKFLEEESAWITAE